MLLLSITIGIIVSTRISNHQPTTRSDMKLIINSKKHGEVTFSRPGSFYIYVDLNGHEMKNTLVVTRHKALLQHLNNLGLTSEVSQEAKS
jgi:lipoate-protein ligase B